MPTVTFSDNDNSNMSYRHETSSYDYVRRASDDLNRYKLSDLIEMDEYEEDFFGNRLYNNFSSTPNKSYETFKNYKSPFENPTCFLRDLFEEYDFFGNPLISYPRRLTQNRLRNYTQDLFRDDFFRDFSSTNSYGNTKPPKGFVRERSSSRERSPSLRRTSLGSTGTASSMDALWDLHPRRLSEAGLSRHSDSSAVLTEDTNSFIIGQRVFVGGTKPGQIAYIGETQFAPGEWAGIVLDQPIGKNDGSVGGIRYFQCEAKRGVFSRLTRLTRYPLGPDGGAGDASYCTTPSPTNGIRKSMVSPVATSTRSPLNISSTSLASAHVDFKVGDRVIIKSSQGSKVGTLRFMGFTSFANGEWCGVELDEPRGKNDGSVAGERYFDCRPNYGLFAPVNKVSRSPSNRKPGNCVVHSSMRRSNSKESLLSMNSSMASTSVSMAGTGRRVRLGVTSLGQKKSQASPKTSTPLSTRSALQDVLNEKQQHIEQLMKELDLERGETTRAAGLADEAEQKYVLVQKDFDNYRAESERKLIDFGAKLERIQHENKELLEQLDEEKQKIEDYQFKFEETKAVEESTNEEHVAKIAALEVQIAQNNAKLEVETQELVVTKDLLMKLREENESIKVELTHASEKRSLLENEESKSIELVQSLQLQVEDANRALKEHQEIALKQSDVLNKQITKIQSEHEVAVFKLNKELEELRAKYSTDVNSKNEELKTLTINYEEAKTLLEETRKDFEKFKYDANTNEQSLRKEMDKLRMDVSAKVVELESQRETMKNQSSDLKKLEDELSKTQKNLESQIKETENVNMEEEKSMIEVNKLKQLLEESNAANDKLKEELQAHTETNKKNGDMWNAKYVEINEQLTKTTTELETKDKELREMADKLQTSQNTFATAQQTADKVKNEFEQFQAKLQEECALNQQEKTKSAQLELQLGDTQRNAQQIEEKYNDALKIKEKLQTEIQQLIGASGEESSKLDILNKELHHKQEEYENMKKQLEDKISNLEHTLQETHMKLTNNEANYNTEKSKMESEMTKLQENMKDTCEKNEKIIEILQQNFNELKGELETTKQVTTEQNKIIEKYKHDIDLELQNKTVSESSLLESNKFKIELENKLAEAQTEIEKLTEEIRLTNEQLRDANKSLQVQTSENEKECSTIQKQLEEAKTAHETAVAEKDTSVKELLARIEEIEKQTSQQDAVSTQKDLEIESLKQEHVEIKKHSEELRIDNENDKQKLENIQAEYTKLNEKYNEIIVNVQEKEQKLIESLKTESTLFEKDKKIANLEAKIDEMHKTVESFAGQLELSKTQELELQKNLETKAEHIQKLETILSSKEQEGKDVNSNLLGKNEEIIKLQKQLQVVTSSMEEISKSNAQLKLEVSQMNDAQVVHRAELESAQKQSTLFGNMVKRLKVTEEHKAELLKEMSSEDAAKKLIEGLKVQKLNDNKEHITELEKTINTSNENLVTANNTIKKQQTEIMLLQQDVLKLCQEREKIKTTVPATDESMNNNNTMNSNAYKQLMEEKLQAEGEVQFLQSIIADMQRKHEEQKARIEILEKGFNPDDVDELLTLGITEKKIAPRMYCDICEEFDLHETEDCPTQADEDMPPPPPPPGKKKAKPPPRDYCDICEVFGHATEDCTAEEETY